MNFSPIKTYIVAICTQNIVSSNSFQTIRSNSPLRSFSSSTKTYNHNGQEQKQDPSSAAPELDTSRRNVFNTMAVAASVPLQFLVSSPPKKAEAALVEPSSNLPNGLLETRVLENVLSPPPYGIETSDVLYPSYFYGVWDVQSKTTDVIAPCGITLFGGNNTYTKAQNEIGTTLSYKCRFVPSTAALSTNSNELSAPIIADREYNVIEIAKSAMGTNSILDVPLVTPNKVSVILSPAGANQIFQADLFVLSRRSEYVSNCDFHCSEVVRQIIAPARSGGRNNPSTPSQQPMAARSSSLLKEIETTSLYTAIRKDDGSVQEIVCRQRSATFLLPSQDPMGYKMYEATRGRPIDCRFYDIVYTKRA